MPSITAVKLPALARRRALAAAEAARMSTAELAETVLQARSARRWRVAAVLLTGALALVGFRAYHAGRDAAMAEYPGLTAAEEHDIRLEATMPLRDVLMLAQEADGTFVLDLYGPDGTLYSTAHLAAEARMADAFPKGGK